MDSIKKLFSYENKMTLLKMVMFFYMFIGGNYISDLYSGQLKDFLVSNRVAQHFICFVTILVLIITSSNITQPLPIIIYSILGYIWFILTTKLSLGWNLAIIILILMGFMYETITNKKQKILLGDSLVPEEDRIKIMKKHNVTRWIIIGSILAVTVFGALQYLLKKQLQYGGEFDIETFFFAAGKRHT